MTTEKSTTTTTTAIPDSSPCSLTGAEARALVLAALEGHKIEGPASDQPMRDGYDGHHDIAALMFAEAYLDFKAATDPEQRTQAGRLMVATQEWMGSIEAVQSMGAWIGTQVRERVRAALTEPMWPASTRIRRRVERDEHGNISALVDEREA